MTKTLQQNVQMKINVWRKLTDTTIGSSSLLKLLLLIMVCEGKLRNKFEFCIFMLLANRRYVSAANQ